MQWLYCKDCHVALITLVIGWIDGLVVCMNWVYNIRIWRRFLQVLGPVSLTFFPSQFTLSSILTQWSLQNVVHGATAMLWWHMQKLLGFNGQQRNDCKAKFSIELGLRTKIVSETGPWSFLRIHHLQRASNEEPWRLCNVTIINII